MLVGILELFELAIFVTVVLSWIRPAPGSALAPVARFVWTITDPVLGPLRRMLPSMGGLDFSPFIALLVIQIILIPVAARL
jgi:YggT family protein